LEIIWYSLCHIKLLQNEKKKKKEQVHPSMKFTKISLLETFLIAFTDSHTFLLLSFLWKCVYSISLLLNMFQYKKVYLFTRGSKGCAKRDITHKIKFLRTPNYFFFHSVCWMRKMLNRSLTTKKTNIIYELLCCE
jgi:hypothetical protein